jgi:hypothetical protein
MASASVLGVLSEVMPYAGELTKKLKKLAEPESPAPAEKLLATELVSVSVEANEFPVKG